MTATDKSAARQALKTAAALRIRTLLDASAGDWQARVRAAGRCVEYVAFLPESGPGLKYLAAYLNAVDPAVQHHAHDAIDVRSDDCVTFGLLVGYALARTEQGDPARWPHRALDFVGGPVRGVIGRASWARHLAGENDDCDLAASLAADDADDARRAAAWRADDARSLPVLPADVLALVEEYRLAMGWRDPGEVSAPRDIAWALGGVLKATVPPLEVLRLQLGVLLAGEQDASSADAAERIGSWLRAHALADAAPAEVVARLLADPAALERLRPTPV